MDCLVYQGGVAQDNDFSVSHYKTVNHINLHPSSMESDFDEWNRQVGTLIQTGSLFAVLKPVLELVTLSIEPERIFLVPHIVSLNNLEHQYTEIVIVVDDSKMDIKTATLFIKMAGLKLRNTYISLHSVKQMEEGWKSNNIYYTMTCREAFLTFSNNPYRLPAISSDKLKELSERAKENFLTGINIADSLIETIKSCSHKEQNSVAVSLIIHSVLEQIYGSVINIFCDEPFCEHSLISLNKRASNYLPHINTLDFKSNILDLLDDIFIRRRDCAIILDDKISIDNLLEMVNEIKQNITFSFEMKISYLSSHKIELLDLATH